MFDEWGYFYSLYRKFGLILYLLQIEYLVNDFQCMFGIPLYQSQVLLNDRIQTFCESMWSMGATISVKGVRNS